MKLLCSKVFLHDQSWEGHKSWNKEEQEAAVGEPKSPHPHRRSRWPGLERDMLKMDLSNWTVKSDLLHSASCMNQYETVDTRAATNHHFHIQLICVLLSWLIDYWLVWSIKCPRGRPQMSYVQNTKIFIFPCHKRTKETETETDSINRLWKYLAIHLIILAAPV